MSLLKHVFRREHPVTSSLIAINTAAFVALALATAMRSDQGLTSATLWTSLVSPSKLQSFFVTLRDFGALQHLRVWDGEYWRIFTPMFLHIGLLHFLFNTYALLILGRVVEGLLGSRCFGLLYLSAGICGSIGSLLFTKGICAGASGAIFGLLGALLAIEYMMRGGFAGFMQGGMRGSVLPIIVINLALGWAVQMIDNNAHIAGLLAGCAVGYFMAARRYGQVQHFSRSAATLAVFATLAGMGLFKGVRPTGERWEHEFKTGALILMVQQKPEQAIPHLERAAQLNPKAHEAWHFLARAYKALKPPQWQRSLDASAQASKHAPRGTQKERETQRAYVLYHGMSLEDLYRVEDALKVYAEALGANPKAKEIRSRATSCLLDLERHSEALLLCTAGLKEYSRDVSCYHGIVQASRALGKSETAARAHEFITDYYEKSYRDLPDALTANNLAWTYAEGDEELDKALHLAREAVKEKLDEPTWLDTLGWVQYKRGELDIAIETLRKVTKIDPRANYAYYHLAVVLAKADRGREALNAVIRALHINRLFEERWAARALAEELKGHLGGVTEDAFPVLTQPL